MTERVVVVAAHPDDEIIGCGATMARHRDKGDEVHIVIVAEGATSRPEHQATDTADLRTAAHSAAKIVGAASLTMLGLPDNRLDSMDLLDVVRPIEKVLDEIRPTVAYTHHPGDLNIDHICVHRAMVTALRPQPSSSLEALLLFEVASSTGWNPVAGATFVPNLFVDVSEWMAKKAAALSAYGGEIREWPHARSTEAITALAKSRGATVGVAAAEAFVVERIVVNRARPGLSVWGT